jgi:Ca2+-binding EF-hand superfamily protein
MTQIYTRILKCKYRYINIVLFNYRQYEKIVIEDVLESSGISLKPTSKQLNEFSKKIKSLNHQFILRNLFERMNKSIIENDNKTLAKLLYVIQTIIQDNSNVNYINFLKQQSKLFENLFNKNINKVINVVSAEIYKALTNTNVTNTVYGSTFASYLTNNFNSVDKNADGKISADEIQTYMNNIATQGLTREQIMTLGGANGMTSSLQETVLAHFDDIDANHDGKVTNQEINAYGVNSSVEKQKIADRNRTINNMSMFYGNDDTKYEGSLMDYRYLSDDEG